MAFRSIQCKAMKTLPLCFSLWPPVSGHRLAKPWDGQHGHASRPVPATGPAAAATATLECLHVRRCVCALKTIRRGEFVHTASRDGHVSRPRPCGSDQIVSGQLCASTVPSVRRKRRPTALFVHGLWLCSPLNEAQTSCTGLHFALRPAAGRLAM